MFARKSSLLDAYKKDTNQNLLLDHQPTPSYNMPKVEEVAEATGGTYKQEQVEIAKLLREAKTTYSSISSRLSSFIFASQDNLGLGKDELTETMECIIAIKTELDDNLARVLQLVLKK